MLKPFSAALACCLTVTAVAHAQSTVDLRDAAKAAMPATVAIKVDGSKDDFGRVDRVWRRSILQQTPLNPIDSWVYRELQTDSETWRSGFAISPDLVISLNVPSEPDELEIVAGSEKLTGKVVGRDAVTGLVAIGVQPADVLGDLTIGLEPTPAGLPVGITWLRDGKHKTIHAAMIASEPAAQVATRGFTQALDTGVSSQVVGAPIVDVQGTLVGVGFMTEDGEALCLPAVHVERLVAAIKEKQVVVLLRGRIGIVLGEKGQPVVTDVTDGLPAHEAGLAAGDRILKIGDHVMNTHSDVLAAVAMFRAGDSIAVVVQRGDETFEKTLTLAAIPEEQDPYAFRPTPTRTAPPSPKGQAFKIEEGKLVPFDTETGKAIEDDILEFKDLIVPWTQPKGLKSIEVERSKLEQALRAQDEQLKTLNDKVKAMQSEQGKPRVESDTRVLKELLEEMRTLIDEQRKDE